VEKCYQNASLAYITTKTSCNVLVPYHTCHSTGFKRSYITLASNTIEVALLFAYWLESGSNLYHEM